MLRPVEPRSLPDDVFGQLLAEIVGGRYAPGDALPSERALTALLEVNRHVVREALKRLEQIGLVKTAQGGRTRVLDFRHTAGLDLLAVFAEHAQALEGMLEAAMQMRAVIGLDVARLAAQNASPEIRQELPRLADQLASIGRGPELLALDQRLWRRMLDGAGNLAYQLAFNSLIRSVNANANFNLRWLEHELERSDYRRPIARAIAAGDPQAAVEATRQALAPPRELLPAKRARAKRAAS